MKRYYIWTDSQSEIELPPELDHKRFDSLAEADTAASNAAHLYDGDQRRCIVHVEDGLYEETVTTYENFGNHCDA